MQRKGLSDAGRIAEGEGERMERHLLRSDETVNGLLPRPCGFHAELHLLPGDDRAPVLFFEKHSLETTDQVALADLDLCKEMRTGKG